MADQGSAHSSCTQFISRIKHSVYQKKVLFAFANSLIAATRGAWADVTYTDRQTDYYTPCARVPRLNHVYTPTPTHTHTHTETHSHRNTHTQKHTHTETHTHKIHTHAHAETHTNTLFHYSVIEKKFPRNLVYST